VSTRIIAKPVGPIRRGIADSLPLFIPAIPFTLVFGIVVRDVGVAAWLGWSSSPIIFGGAAQITLLTLLGEGASVVAASTAALIVGARHLLYSVTLAPRFQDQPAWFRWVGSYMLIDQVFALTAVDRQEDPKVFRHYYLAAGTTFWCLWMTFTALGIVLGPKIPSHWQLSFAAPALFMGLLAVTIDRWQKAAVAISAMAFTGLLADLPNRSGLLIGALLAIGLGIILERVRR